MERQPSLLRRMTGRSHRDPQAEDEWFIPYKPPGQISYQTGIGNTPHPLPPSRGFSFFNHDDGTSSKHSQHASSSYAAQPFSVRPLASRRPTFARRSTSDDLISYSSSLASARIPSSTSVPTGLAAPKLLFSPLQREMQGNSLLPATATETRSPPHIRKRTSSIPQTPTPTSPYRRTSYRPRAHHDTDAKRWAASSMCDLLVFPRPHIAAHTITPPESPAGISSTMDSSILTEPRAVYEGRAREQEREEWAGYVRDRGRSASFKGNGILPRGRSQSGERSRKDSGTSTIGGRLRSGSLGSMLSRPKSTRQLSEGGKTYTVVNDAPVTSVCGLKKLSKADNDAHESSDQGLLNSHDVDDPFRRQRRSEVEMYRPSQQTNRSTPNPLVAGDPSMTARARVGPSRPLRSLRIQSPPTNPNAVVVIGPQTTAAPVYAEYTQPDFSKPLPPLPHQAPHIEHSPPHSPFKPFRNSADEEIGVAVSPDPAIISIPAGTAGSPSKPRQRRQPSSSIYSGPQSQSYSVEASPTLPQGDRQDRPMSTGEPSPAAARAILAKQHQRAITKRAFQSPLPQRRPRPDLEVTVARQSTASSIYPSSIASGSASVARSSTSSAEAPRRKTALEEAIGRSRANSVEQPQRKNIHGLTLDPAPRRRAGSDATSRSTSQQGHEGFGRVPPLSPTLAYPISTDPPERSALLAPPALARPPLSQANSAASGVTQYSDASEGWDRTPTPRLLSVAPGSPDDTPSPVIPGHDDFRGLFFQTPVDRQNASFVKSNSSYRAVPPALFRSTQNPGLGFDMETDERRRESQSDDSTVEIVTPRMHGEQVIGQQGYVQRTGRTSTTASPHSQHDERSSSARPETPASATSYIVSSTEGSPEVPSSEEFVLSDVRRGEIVYVATPKLSDDNTGFLRPVSSLIPLLGTSTPRRSISTSTFGTIAGEIDQVPQLQPSQIQPSPNISLATPASGFRRDSTAVSFMDEFPSPPHNDLSTMPSLSSQMPKPPSPSHRSAFGQLVTGPPGAGKSTYCHGIHQFCTALGRPIHIINLDPAVSDPPYPCSISITSLITLESVMEEYGLGPNGAILYCIEYLEANFDWLVDELDKLLEADEGNGYVVFDTPGQVELWTNHESLKNMVERLVKMDYRLAAVHLSDAHYITDAPKFISVVLLALRAMLQLELPHINVLSKIDLLSTYGELPFDLRYYTEVQDLSYLLQSLEKQPRMGKFEKLNKAMVELVEDYGLVGFETLAVEDKASMMKLLRQIDKATGYVFMAPSYDPESTNEGRSTTAQNTHALFSTAQGVSGTGWLGDVEDVQERWGRNKEVWDEREREEWRKEGELRAREGGGGGAVRGEGKGEDEDEEGEEREG